MATQFRNIDLKGPEKVRIMWAMETPRDDTSDRPDERDEGFWPSHDKDAAGYVLPENFDEQQRIAEERMRAWENDEWEYIGVVAVARVWIPIGNGSYCFHDFRSAGIWGIESDCKDYVEEQFAEQKAELSDQLKVLGAALASGDILDQTN
jgi:hypothetical protein